MKDIEKRVVQFKNAKTRQELAESIGYRYKFIVYFIFYLFYILLLYGIVIR